MPGKNASIFNDVIGPVMRGPSSSHTAASWRIGKLAMQFMKAPLKKALVEFDRNGGWATNFRDQGTTLGMDGGLLGIDITDDRMKHLDAEARKQNVEIVYEISSFESSHPNTVRITLTDLNLKSHQFIAESSGGGSFKLKMFDGLPLNLRGDCYSLILVLNDEESAKAVSANYPAARLTKGHPGNGFALQVDTSKPLASTGIDFLRNSNKVAASYKLEPVMPVLIARDSHPPFSNAEELIDFASREGLDLGSCGLIYETALTGTDKDTLSAQMDGLIGIMDKSVERGRKGTNWQDRILPQQSHLIGEAVRNGRVLGDNLINEIITNVTAIMESKSAMEVIVANPTAGSCVTVAGVVQVVANKMNVSKEELIKAYFAAGMAGVFFANGPGFAAEEHGCQVECGASAGMAAAAIVQLCGGDAKAGLNAASMAIQNMIGLVCDPIADRVEAPCLGKNVSAAVNAYASATMVLAGFNALIPYDQVLETVNRVGNMMPGCHKCTGEGGLAITPAAKLLKAQLAELKLDG